jgi:hypothetical protein
MDRDKIIRDAVAREIAPLLVDCARINAELEQDESRLPIIVIGEHSERDAIRFRREKLAKIIGELQIDRVVQTILHHIDER